MAYTNLFTNVVCDTSSQLKCTAGYEMQRVGVDMQYRYQITLSVPNGYFIGDLIGINIWQDSARVLTGTFYDPDGTDTNGWSYTGVTDWFTTTNKLTGTTSLRIGVYDNQGAVSYNKSIPSSSTYYQMAILPASSTVFATNTYIGDSVLININRIDVNYYHRLFIRFTGITEIELTGYNGIDVSYSHPLPTSLYAEIPNAMSILGFVKVKTYTDSARTVQIGTDSTNVFNALVNPTANAPTVLGTVVDVDTVIRSGTPLTTDNNSIVKNRSDGQYAITATGQNSATIVSYQAKCGTVIQPLQNGTITNAQSNIFELSAVDSRGLSTIATVTKTLIDYLPPSCSWSIERTTNLSDNKVQITASGDYWADTFGAVANTLSIRFRYKELGGAFSSWINIANAITATSGGVTITGNAYSISSWILENGSGVDLTVFDYTKSWLIELEVFDKIDTLAYTETGGNAKTIATTIPVYDIRKDLVNFNVPVNIDGSSVIDSGSNANGDYIKFYDGTMICWFRTSVTNLGITVATGTLFAANYTWTLPQEFYTVPTVTVGTFAHGTNGGWGTAYASTTTTIAYLRGLDTASRASGATAVVISAMAIGRWKA